jgi:micrococcal nuclease
VRKDLLGSILLLAIVAFLVLRPWEENPEAGPAVAMAVITRVVDGDTVEARIGDEVEDVRLIGVDTPETVKPGTPVQCYGERASHFSKRALSGRRVRLVFGVERRDVYGRLLAYVYLAQRTLNVPQHVESHLRLFNAVLLRRGLARTLTIPPNDRFAPRFGRIQLAAARSGRGLWAACR